MRRRSFVRQGTVSAVGFGCMSFGGFYGPTTESETMRALARALELGVDFWDTANVYGEGLSETMIGKFLAEDRSRRVEDHARDQIRHSPRARRQARVRQQPRAHPREPRRIAEAARRRPRRPLLRPPGTTGASRSRTRSANSRATSKAGTIGAIGLSEVAPDTLRRAAAVHPIAAVQSEYSLWTRNPELGLIQACEEAGAR